MVKYIYFSLLFLGLVAPAQPEEADHAIHSELRTLLSGIETAINTENFADLKPYFHTKVRVTTVNQNTIFSLDEIDSYFADWFGEGGYLQSLHMTLTPDALTELYHNKTMGIVRGSGIEKYKLIDGRAFDLNTRWTATLLKSDDGKWKVLSLHLGTNFYDNPIFHESRKSLTNLGILGTFVGLLIGLLIGFFLWRKKV